MGPHDLRVLPELRARAADVKIPGYGPDAKLLLYLVLVDQLSDVLQYEI